MMGRPVFVDPNLTVHGEVVLCNRILVSQRVQVTRRGDHFRVSVPVELEGAVRFSCGDDE